MGTITGWLQDRRIRRDNAAYLAEEVQIIDLVAIERERDALLEDAGFTGTER